MNNENKLVPDFRPETIQTYTETYTPEGGTEQTATYKIGTAHPIIGGILDKLAWVRTHVAAVWWNKLAGVTLKDKIDAMDESIDQLNGKILTYDITPARTVTINSKGYVAFASPSDKDYLFATIVTWEGDNSPYGIHGPEGGNFYVIGAPGVQISTIRAAFWRYAD